LKTAIHGLKKEEGRGNQEEGIRKRESGRGNQEEGIRKREGEIRQRE